MKRGSREGSLDCIESSELLVGHVVIIFVLLYFAGTNGEFPKKGRRVRIMNEVDRRSSKVGLEKFRMQKKGPRIWNHHSHAWQAALLVVFVLSIPLGAWGANRSKGGSAENVAATEPHTEAAVIADDNAWEKAEEAGDTAYIDRLLLPEYRSINVDGSINDKDAILAGARKSSPERTAKIHAWLAAHPQKTSVIIIGDTAVLTFALARSGGSTPIMSCDIFVYRDGHWRALYSQHTAAGN